MEMTGAIEAGASVVRASMFRRTGHRLARAMQRRLSPRLYNVMMDGAFGALRIAQREAYRRHELAAALAGDDLRRDRARIVRGAMRRSLVGASGLEATFDAVRSVQVRGVPGCLVELGVAQGGCAALMRAAADLDGPARRLWLFDSYEGLPEPSEADLLNGATGDHIRPLPKGSCLGTYDDVAAYLFDELRLDREAITMVKGWFDTTVPANRRALGTIAVLRIDADWYDSVKACLDGLYDQVSAGGIVIVDDYGTCFGARRAVDEFLVARGIEPALEHDGRGGCLWRKGADASTAQSA